MSRSGVAVLLAALLVTGCATGPDRPPLPERLAASPEAPPRLPELQPYLDAYPLGDLDGRRDLLAFNEERSLYLVQLRRPLPLHLHERHVERVYVLTGSGTVYVGDRSYPARPGSAFRFERGLAHSAHPDEGSTLIALVYYEPPLTGDDDRVPVQD